MIHRQMMKNALRAAIVFAGAILLLPGNVFSHCDSTQGPVIPEAKAALEKGDVTPLLKWIRAEDEGEIREAFSRAMAVRTMGPEAKELADTYFLETLIRVHREGEGAPFTGITDDPIEPVISMADQALANHSVDEIIERINHHLADSIRERYDRVLANEKHKDESVAAGRRYVESYVSYIHYIEGVHKAMASNMAHHRESHDEEGRHEE